MTWLFRAAALLGGPALVYFQVSKDAKGVGIGLGIAVFVILLEAMLERLKLLTIIMGIIGAFFGLLLSLFFDYVVAQLKNPQLQRLWTDHVFLAQAVLAFLGMWITIMKFEEFGDLDKDISALRRRKGADLKVLDTSAVVDGRIMDVCQTHFLSGTLVVPRFVLNELHALADSADPMKRARGRRGLDILARMQEDKVFPMRIMDREVPDVAEVDHKVVRLARDLGAHVVTTDFNLNKLCALEGVTVLNVNDLTTALKPVVLPGEQMSIFIMKEGKERQQGVGYLDDGTMVVVEEGRRLIGKRTDVAVISILQTSAGRMIFAKARGDHRAPEKPEPNAA